MRRFLILMLISCACMAHAQAPRHYRHFTEKDGLSDNRVQSVLHDRQGFVWVGTANGLNRYDGYNFKQYFPDRQHPERSVCSESIQGLKQDKAGQIWIATNNGLNCLDPKTGKFRTWNNVGRNDGSLPNPIVWSMHCDRMDRLWVACDNRDLARYDPVADKFVTYPWRAYVLKTLPQTPSDAYLVIYALQPKSDHALWLLTNVGFFSFDWEANAFAHHTFPKELGPAATASACPETALFGTWDRDIVRFDPCLDRWEQIPLPLPAGLVGGRRLVNQIVPYRGGDCILTRQGMFWLPQRFGKAQRIDRFGDGDADIPSGMLTVGTVDPEGTLWIGGEQGLWLCEAVHQQVRYTQLKPNTADDFYNTFVRFLDLPDGRLLSLDFYYHQLIVSQGDQVLQHIDLPVKASLLYRDSHGVIWIGGGESVFQLDPQTLQLRPFALPKRPGKNEAGGYYEQMTEDSKGNYWFANRKNGVVVWNPQTQKAWFPDSSVGFIGTQLTSLYADTARKTVWIGSLDYGLFRYDEVTGKFTLYQHESNEPVHSLGAFMVTGICRDHQGYIWVATDPGGVSRFDYAAPVGQEFLSLGIAAGLPSNRATSIITDQKGRLWVSTLRGLACLDPQKGRLRAFSKEDGLATDFLDLTLVLAADGRIRNGTIYGYQSFDPDSLLQERIHGAIRLTSFRIFDQELGDSLNLAATKHLELSWRENFFSFEFVSSDVLAARKTDYAYRLQGFDAQWIKTGHRHEASYTNVPPGEYLLEIRSGREGLWNAPGIQLKISISPPYWVTWWFRMLVGIALIVLVYGIYRLRIRQIRREEAIKSEFNQRIAKTEMTALRAQMNPHFVFNCLSSINRFIMVNQPEEASAYLTKFSRLIRLILDNSRTETVLLSKELEALKLYVEMEQMRFADRFEYQLELDKGVQVEHVEIPPLLIQPYVENAIWHGLMHKKEGCVLIVRVFEVGKRLCIEVEDNGVGRAKAMELKSRSAMVQKSHGMKVTSERLEVINRLYGTQATVETTDLIDAQGQAQGTRIRLTL
jgi:ligand-binding sensor domain-containing protein